MLDFPKQTINYIKSLLLIQQKEIEKNIIEVEEEDPAKADSLAESSEPGTDSYLADTHTRDMALKDALKKTNTSIKIALQKITKGTYGKCEECSNAIGVSRLLAIPTAMTCLSCSKKNSQ